MTDSIRRESAAFLRYALQRVASAAGMTDEHAGYIADAIVFAHRQGKLNQGLGVYEAIDIMNQMGLLDIEAVPEIVAEGPTWAVYDGKNSSGYYCMTKMAETAIAKAKELGTKVALKLELLQKTGSFKPRGAFNQLMSLGTAALAREITRTMKARTAAIATITTGLITDATIDDEPFGFCHWAGKPGGLVAVDSFYIGNLKGVGKIRKLFKQSGV